MTKITTATILLTPLILLGAGCSTAPPASDADQQQEAMTDQPDPGKLTVPVPSNGTDGAEQEAGDGGRPPVPTAPVGVLPAERIEGKQVVISTPKGDITFVLYADDAPETVSNFVALAESGYFDGLTFHRVESSFVIQGGDPEGTGRGGPGYRFADEPVKRDYLAGTVAMANAGPDTNGSQFFICLDDLPQLPKSYTIFGQVTAGLDAVRQIAVGDTMDTVTVSDAE